MRPSWAPFSKMFTASYLAVNLAMLALFIPSGSERIGLVTTGLFVAAVNAMAISAATPDTGSATLADHLIILGYSTIGQALFQGLIYHRVFKDPEVPATRLFDRVSQVLIILLFVVANIAVIRAATG